MEAHDIHKKRLKKLKSKYTRQSSKETSVQNRTPRRMSSTSGSKDNVNGQNTSIVDQQNNSQNIAVDREDTRTAVRGGSRPTTPGSSIKRLV